MASSSMNQTQDSSLFNMSNVEQKKEYHKLLEKLSLLDHDTVENEQRVDGTLKVLHEAKSLAGVANSNTSLTLLDSYVLRQVGQQALTAASNIEANANVYNPLELAQHIHENPSFWRFALPRCIPSAVALHGAFEPAQPPPPRVRERRRRVQQQTAELRKPENIDSLKKPQEDVQMVQKMHKLIVKASQSGPLSYFHCVLDPNCFARTVENIYYVSFLLRDDKVAVYIDEERGIPMIRPLARSKNSERDISLENQFIVSIDMAQWQRLVKACNIEKAMMTV